MTYIPTAKHGGLARCRVNLHNLAKLRTSSTAASVYMRTVDTGAFPDIRVRRIYHANPDSPPQSLINEHFDLSQ